MTPIYHSHSGSSDGSNMFATGANATPTLASVPSMSGFSSSVRPSQTNHAYSPPPTKRSRSQNGSPRKNADGQQPQRQLELEGAERLGTKSPSDRSGSVELISPPKQGSSQQLGMNRWDWIEKQKIGEQQNLVNRYNYIYLIKKLQIQQGLSKKERKRLKKLQKQREKLLQQKEMTNLNLTCGPFPSFTPLAGRVSNISGPSTIQTQQQPKWQVSSLYKNTMILK